MATSSDVAVRDWLIAFLGRLWFVVRTLAFVPVLVIWSLISPVWWLLTGREVPIPKWVDRMWEQR